MESGRAIQVHAMHRFLLTLLTQRSALIQAESLRRRMPCAAARRHLTRLVSAAEPPPMTAAEQAQFSERAVYPFQGYHKSATYSDP